MAAVLAALVIYVLSCGPAAHVLPVRAWGTVYAPLVWCGQYEPLAYALLWYLDACGVEVGVEELPGAI